MSLHHLTDEVTLHQRVLRKKKSSMNGLLGLNKIIISSKNRGCPLLVVDDVKFVITDCKVKKDLKMWGTSS